MARVSRKDVNPQLLAKAIEKSRDMLSKPERPSANSKMNGWEKEMELMLRQRLQTGEITQFWFECMKFRLGDGSYYIPDFIVAYPDGRLHAFEVKGYWRDDARVKTRVFAALYPQIGITVAYKKNKQWQWEVINP